MSKTVKKRLHQVFSILVAISLALLMVPIIPGTAQQAVAEGEEWALIASADDFASSMAYDQLDTSDVATVSQNASTEKMKDRVKPEASVSVTPAEVLADANLRVTNEMVSAAADSAAAKKVREALDTDSKLNVAAQSWIAANAPAVATAAKAAIVAELAKTQESVDETKVSIGSSPTFKSAKFKSTSDKAIVNDLVVTNPAKTDNSTAVPKESCTFDDNGYTVGQPGSSDSSILEVGSMDASGNYSLTAKGAGIAEVTIPITSSPRITGYSYTYGGTFDYTYQKIDYKNWTYTQTWTYTYDGGEQQTLDVSADGSDYTYELSSVVSETGVPFVSDSASVAGVTIASDQIQTEEASYKYNVEVKNLFTEEFLAGKELEAKTLEYYSDRDGESVDLFTTSAFADENCRSHALKILGTPTWTPAPDSYSVSYSNGAVTLKPIKVVGSSESTVLSWAKAPNAKYTIKATVNPLSVNYKIDALDFRMQSANEEHTVKYANAAVKAAVKDACGEDISDDLYSAVAFDSYDSQGMTKQNPTVTFTPADNASAYSNFKVTDIESVTVREMAAPEWGSTGLELTPKANSHGWVSEVPTAAWAGHTLLYSSADGKLPANDSSSFAGSVKLNAGDGKHALELYAMDDDQVISRVTKIYYWLDTQAPKFISASYQGKNLVANETLVGDGSVTVDLGISDQVKTSDNGKVPSKDSFENTRSGLVAQPKAAYHDDESGSDIAQFALNGNEPNYSFALKANEDVRTDTIVAYAEDKAGNKLDWVKATDAGTVPANVLRLIADADAPQVSVAWDNNDVRNGRYYNANRTMTITVIDHFFNYIQQYQSDQLITSVRQNGETVIAVTPGAFTQVSTDVWQYTLSFTEDADWEVTPISVADLVGHSGSAAGDSFTVDKTAPTMDVVFDNNSATNGNYYNAPRTATITITEHNFDEGLVNVEPTAGAGNGGSVGSPSVSGWNSDGDVRTASVNFPGQGVYTLRVGGTDQAVNALSEYTASEFIVDTEQPQINISGVENRTASSGAMQPSVQVTDTNISDATTIQISKAVNPASGEDENPYTESRSSSATEISVSYPNPAEVVANDGVYTMTVEAIDMAGNTNSQAVTWSVNRFGSTYVLSDGTSAMLNSYMNSGKLSDVKVTEINPQSLNNDDIAVELTKDTSNSTLKRGQDYSINEGDSSGWHTYEYDIPKRNFSTDGSYKVLLHSQDESSNMSENTMKGKDAKHNANKSAEIGFAVDDINPIMSFADLSDGGTYNETEHTAKVSIEDNLKLDHAIITVDGKEVKSLDAGELAGGAVHEITVQGGDAPQLVEVTAYDAANNHDTVAAHVTVTTNPFVLWMANTPLFVGSIVGGCALIGGAVAFFVFRARRVG